MNFPHSRPYRSHLRPACESCRRRKSRCTVEAGFTACLMCRVHNTPCSFPDRSSARSRQSSRRETPASLSNEQPPAPLVTEPPPLQGISELQVSAIGMRSQHGDNNGSGDSIPSQPTPLSVDHVTGANPHIVGPAVTTDSQILADYLSTLMQDNGSLRMVRPHPASRSRPVLFASVQRRPLGIDNAKDPSSIKLEIIEKLIEPWGTTLTNLYFDKVDLCLPLLDKQFFLSQYQTSKEKLSPALLASLYAQSLIFWRLSPLRSQHRSPDIRFIWNLANEVLYSELHLNPGISTITAILLNIGGRPTTSLMGNGVLLGAAVSLANSLGLNRNPLAWDIPEYEKLSRMKIWWALYINDKWASVAYGTPSHISASQYDVPLPCPQFFEQCTQDAHERKATMIFSALAGLTDVLAHYLQVLFDTTKSRRADIADLEHRLNQWMDQLDTSIRHIVTRGNDLSLQGAANLRLAYLSVQLLLRRLTLEEDAANEDPGSAALANKYIQVRRTAEDIVVLVQELQPEQLGGFWMPVSAFVLQSATTFLIRCALETQDSVGGLARSSSLRLASDLLVALRRHRQEQGWDLGDICLAQHSEVVEKLTASPNLGDVVADIPIYDLQDIVIPDVDFVDELLPNLWDTFQDT